MLHLLYQYVYYDNSKSGGTSTNVAVAIDELYNLSDIRKRPNIIVGYTYYHYTYGPRVGARAVVEINK